MTSFDEFDPYGLLTEAQEQDYKSTYILLHEKFKKDTQGDKESIIQDLVFEIELVKQVEINVDYILILVKELQGAGGADKEIMAKISRTVASSYTLRSKKDLIEKFVASVNNQTDVVAHWKNFIDGERKAELDEIIRAEGLNEAETIEFVTKAFADGQLKTAGTAVVKLLPARNMFSASAEHAIQKAFVIDKLKAFFERFSNL